MTQSAFLAEIGQRYLREAVLGTLYESYDPKGGFYPVELSQRLSIFGRSIYKSGVNHIVSGVLGHLVKQKRCGRSSRTRATWEDGNLHLPSTTGAGN